LTDRWTDGQTDRQTDRILIARSHLHSMQRGKNESGYKYTYCKYTLTIYSTNLHACIYIV